MIGCPEVTKDELKSFAGVRTMPIAEVRRMLEFSKRWSLDPEHVLDTVEFLNSSLEKYDKLDELMAKMGAHQTGGECKKFGEVNIDDDITVSDINDTDAWISDTGILIRRGDVVECVGLPVSSSSYRLKGIYLGHSDDYFYVLTEDDRVPLEFEVDQWSLKKLGGHVDLFKESED